MNAQRQTENLEKIYESIDKLKLLMNDNRKKKSRIMSQLDQLELLSSRSVSDPSVSNHELDLEQQQKQERDDDHEQDLEKEPHHVYSKRDFLPENVINILISKYGPSINPITITHLQESQKNVNAEKNLPNNPHSSGSKRDGNLQYVKAQNAFLREIFQLLTNDNNELLDFLQNDFEVDINERLIKQLRYSIYVNNMNFLKFFQNQYNFNIINLEVETLNLYIDGIEQYDELLKISEVLRNLFRIVSDHVYISGGTA